MRITSSDSCRYRKTSANTGAANDALAGHDAADSPGSSNDTLVGGALLNPGL